MTSHCVLFAVARLFGLVVVVVVVLDWISPWLSWN